MTREIGVAALVFVLVATASGVGLSWYALARYRSASAPSVMSWRPSDWRLVWRTRDWFTEAKGFWIYLVGMELVSLGAVVGFVVFAFGPGRFGP